jgi:hypothetical protein
MNNEAKPVPSNVEYDPIILDEVHRRTELDLNIPGSVPNRRGCDGMPGAKRHLWLIMKRPKLLQGAKRDHLHRPC